MSTEARYRRIVAHRGACHAYLPRYRSEAREASEGSPRAFQQFCENLFEYASDERNLWDALTYLERHGGAACGLDQLRISDLMSMDRWALVRRIRDTVRMGQYERGPLMKRRIPKRAGSSEKRTIYVATLPDRVLTRGLYQIAGPLLRRFMDPLVFSQPRAGVGRALAHARALLVLQGSYIWITEDARNAFDVVPRPRLLQVLQSYIPNRDFCELAVRLSARPDRKGILQGAALSSMLLDIYLHHFLHRPWRRDRRPNRPIRYADDVLVTCTNPAEACCNYEYLVKCLRDAGMSPRNGPDRAIVDLRQNETTWLGYNLRWRDGELRIRPKWFDVDRSECVPKYRDSLVEKFRRLHDRPDGWRYPDDVVRGLIDYLAPTLPYVDFQAIYREITSAARESAFEEFMAPHVALEVCRSAHSRWRQMAEEVVNELRGKSVTCGLPG